MKALLLAISVGILATTASANASAATDWTPYLKPMLSGCNYLNITDNLPSKYKASITNKKTTGNPNNEGEEVITTYTLKNATAFGQPLQKVEYLQGYEWSHTKLYFKDAKFMALRPQFKLPELDEYSEVTKNNANGYEIEMGSYLYLDFDKKDNSITCGDGV